MWHYVNKIKLEWIKLLLATAAKLMITYLMANNSKMGNINVGASQINIYDNCLIINCCWNKNFTDLKIPFTLSKVVV